MTTCREILADALSALGVVTFGGEATADEIEGGLAAMATILLDLHESRGPMREIDVSADFVASEDQRVRVAADAQVVVTLPNSIRWTRPRGTSDYGCVGSDRDPASAGSIGAADGVQSRPPRDGARVEIVGVTQALYFYRSDLNAWVSVGPLTIDGSSPLNTRYNGALAALVAERLCDPMNVAPTPTLAKRIARGNAALMIRPATARRPARPAYF